jgi:hypothetical protein
MTSGAHKKIDFVEKAITTWGTAPDWVIALAEAVNAKSLRLVGERLTVSSGMLSNVLANKYRGDLGKIEARVRGAFMNETVACPVLGEIGRDRCLEEQTKDFTGTSSMRTRLHHACRNGCPHSRLKRD